LSHENLHLADGMSDLRQQRGPVGPRGQDPPPVRLANQPV